MSNKMPTNADINILLAYLPQFDKPDRQFAQWRGGEKTAEGHLTLPYPVYDKDVEEFFEAASQPCWSDTAYRSEAAQKMLDNQQALDKANIEDIRTMLTYCVRGERFCEGHRDALLKAGKIVALLRRLQQIQSDR